MNRHTHTHVHIYIHTLHTCTQTCINMGQAKKGMTNHAYEKLETLGCSAILNLRRPHLCSEIVGILSSCIGLGLHTPSRHWGIPESAQGEALPGGAVRLRLGDLESLRP